MSDEIVELKLKQSSLESEQTFLKKELQLHREEYKVAIHELKQSNQKLENTVDKRITNLALEMRSISQESSKAIQKVADALKDNTERQTEALHKVSEKQEKKMNAMLWIASIAAVAIVVSITTAGLKPTVHAVDTAANAVKSIK